jgi:hypothetical protein
VLDRTTYLYLTRGRKTGPLDRVKFDADPVEDVIQLYLLFAGMILVTFLSGAISMMIFTVLEESGETAMTKMRLHPEATFKEFKILMWAHAVQASGLFILAFGAAAGNNAAVQIGRLATIIQGAATIAVVYRWWRRFQ